MSTSPAPSNQAAGSPASDGRTEPRRARGPYWKTLLAIPVLAALVLGVLWPFANEDSSQQTIFILAVVSGTVLLLLLWWLFLSGLTLRTRLGGLLAVAVMAGAFFLAFEPRGFSGDFIPQFAPRWQPTSEERLASFLKTAPRPEAPATTAVQLDSADWPGFRGPRRDSIVRGVTLRRDWEQNPPKQLWRHPVGLGWSSFAIVDELVYTQEQRGENETVVCYELETGAQVWEHADKTRFSEALGGDGPRSTPTFHDGRLYSLGATGILNCFDPLTGSVYWSRNILADAGLDPETGNLKWAMAGSPLVFRDLVVVNPGGRKGKAVIAYDRIEGTIRWSGGSRMAGYSSPMLASLGGVEQILVFGGEGLAGHDPTNGNELWFQPWETHDGINATQPIVLPDESIFLSSGYAVGCGLFAVERTGNTWQVREHAWGKRDNTFKLKFNDGVLKDGFIYGLDEGILACFNVATGEIAWKKGRYKYGQILLVDDLLLIISESGRVVLVEANPNEFREVAAFQALSGKTWNHPALAHGRLLVRNAEEAACFDIE